MSTIAEEGWRLVAKLEELQEGQPVAVSLGSTEIGLFRVGDEVFAINNICTHGLARLTDGYQDGFTIECPLHQGVFDVRSGKCVAPPVDVDAAAYDVQVVDGSILISMRELSPNPKP